jgi:hypothetical protein
MFQLFPIPICFNTNHSVLAMIFPWLKTTPTSVFQAIFRGPTLPLQRQDLPKMAWSQAPRNGCPTGAPRARPCPGCRPLRMTSASSRRGSTHGVGDVFKGRNMLKHHNYRAICEIIMDNWDITIYDKKLINDTKGCKREIEWNPQVHGDCRWLQYN